MFTVEMEGEDTIVRTLDQSGENEDLELIIDSDGDYILRQYNDNFGAYDLVVMSGQQFRDICAAMNLPVGTYYAEQK